MNINQIYFPEFGYSAPKRTKKECENPAFSDKRIHRMGIFALEYHSDGLTGYSVCNKCVNCGKRFKFPNGSKSMFIASKKLEDAE